MSAMIWPKNQGLTPIYSWRGQERKVLVSRHRDYWLLARARLRRLIFPQTPIGEVCHGKNRSWVQPPPFLMQPRTVGLSTHDSSSLISRAAIRPTMVKLSSSTVHSRPSRNRTWAPLSR